MERTTLTERLRRAEADIAAGRPEQALGYCQELQTAYPRALGVQRTLGQIYLALRRPREALAALDRALAGDPEDVRACCARALVHQMHGDDVAALAWFRHACDLRPDDQTLRVTYRDLARRLGEPPYRPSRAGLARLYLRGDQFPHAIREWEQLVSESPDMLDAQVGLAETLWLAGHTRAAEERCLRILANAPSCVKAMLIQMAIALADGDMDTARAHLQRTLQLDPDMALAQAFFADALAAGDPVLTALLRGSAGSDEAMKMSRPTAGFAQSGPVSGQRNVSRPLVTSAPVTSGPAFAGPLSSSQPLPPPPRPDAPVPSQPTQVTRAFRETAFMIWGQDEDSQPQIPAQSSDGARGSESDAAPALRDLDSTAADDDETRRALNWYNWLQSQGAVALGSAVSSAPMPPTPVPPAPEQARGPSDLIAGSAGSADIAPTPPDAVHGGSPKPIEAAGGPRLTMPIPPAQQADLLVPAEPTLSAPQEEEQATIPLPSSNVLRTMFAELAGNGAASPVVESDEVVASTDDALSMAGTAQGAQDEAYEAYDSAYEAARDGRDTSVAEEDNGQPSEPQTLEDLERQFSASGFTHIETHRGILAEMEREQQAGNGAAPQETPPGEDYTREEPPGSDAVAHAPVVSEPDGPDPRDYPARLARARQRRDDGQLDDALNEYRVIIKNAPDLLPEVLNDLYASLAEQPEHSNLHSVLGDALVCQGEYEKALESYNKAMELAQARSGKS